MMPESALTVVAEDKEMTSPSMWTSSSATQMSMPSIDSDSSVSSSIASKQGVEALVDYANPAWILTTSFRLLAFPRMVGWKADLSVAPLRCALAV